MSTSPAGAAGDVEVAPQTKKQRYRQSQAHGRSSWGRPSSTMPGIDPTVPLARFSCSSCKAAKRKCDRVLPICSGCTKKRIRCQYRDRRAYYTDAQHFQAARGSSTRSNGSESSPRAQTQSQSQNLLSPASSGDVNSNSISTPYPDVGSRNLNAAASANSDHVSHDYFPIVNSIVSVNRPINNNSSVSEFQHTSFRFPSVYFLDNSLFHTHDLHLPDASSLPIPAYLKSALYSGFDTDASGHCPKTGTDADLRFAAAHYFNTVHSWFPIVARKRFYQQVLNPLATPQVDGMLLLLCIKLSVWVPDTGSYPTRHNTASTSASASASSIPPYEPIVCPVFERPDLVTSVLEKEYGITNGFDHGVGLEELQDNPGNQPSIPKSHDPRTSEYYAAKRALHELEAAGVLSLRVLQAAILVAVYEVGHAIYPSAFLTVGLCARNGVALGLDKEGLDGRTTFSWFDEEERRRTWWAVIILDRFMNLGNPSRVLAIENPPSDYLLPVDDEEFERASFQPPPFFPVSSSAILKMGNFARLAQATYLLGLVLKHVSSTPVARSSHRLRSKQTYSQRTYHNGVTSSSNNRHSAASIPYQDGTHTMDLDPANQPLQQVSMDHDHGQHAQNDSSNTDHYHTQDSAKIYPQQDAVPPPRDLSDYGPASNEHNDQDESEDEETRFHLAQAQQLHRTIKALSSLTDVESQFRKMAMCPISCMCYSGMSLLNAMYPSLHLTTSNSDSIPSAHPQRSTSTSTPVLSLLPADSIRLAKILAIMAHTLNSRQSSSPRDAGATGTAADSNTLLHDSTKHPFPPDDIAPFVLHIMYHGCVIAGLVANSPSPSSHHSHSSYPVQQQETETEEEERRRNEQEEHNKRKREAEEAYQAFKTVMRSAGRRWAAAGAYLELVSAREVWGWQWDNEGGIGAEAGAGRV